MKDSYRQLSIKTALTILTVISTFVSYSATYYLAPGGSDTSGNGSSSSPWKTMNKAWAAARAGDVIYMKGGTYSYNSTQNLKGKSGASGNPIKIWAVPGEKPIINPSSSFSSIRGIDIECNYLHLKGLEISNFKQRTSSSFFYGIYAQNINYVTFETLKVHDNGFGLSIGQDSGNNLVLNSDFYRNADPLTNISGMIPYGGADGLTIRSSNVNKTNTIRGCRMWWNSDDGIDLFGNNGTIIIEYSWAFWNGYKAGSFTSAGDGNGFKLGNTSIDVSSSVKRILRFNLAFQNRKIGFDQNEAKCITQLYNNTSYDNANTGSTALSYSFAYGPQAHVAKNNIEYKSSRTAYFSSQSTVSNNTFQKSGAVNTAYSVSSSDFQSLDNTGVDGPRQSDGSLPNLKFLRLASTSDLLNKGSNVGLPYSGSAPDLGAFELSATTFKSAVDTMALVVTEEEISLDGNLTTDIEENINDDYKIDVYPNPCVDNITVRFSKMPEAGSRIDIYNVAGQRVESREITNPEESISLGTQAPGLYMVKTTVGSKQTTTKLILSR